MNTTQYKEFIDSEIGSDYWLSKNISINRKSNAIKVNRFYTGRSGIDCAVIIKDFSIQTVRKAIILAKREIAEEYNYVKPLDKNLFYHCSTQSL